MKIKSLIASLAMLTACGAATAGPGWPANYEGVMLQGFYWDSYEDTKWTNLTSQADELSQYFKLIWIPNSGKCGDYKNMGYMPQYWFTNHNSSFGTETELRNMIQTFKAKGTGFIADVVINHRNGLTNWTDFPAEEWNGRTWHIGPEGICCNDEVSNASGQARPTGAYDTGDNFDGCRDLDHTNANVQENCKNYCKFLLEDLGYAGFRYDMVKGYGGQYNKIYNEYSNPTYSVGEYWDSSYDNVAGWINATGKTSAAFDFPCKYAINKAFSSNDMRELVWNANGTTPQPAGMIHFGYSQYAVTFVDNHDTYRDGSKFNGNVVAANAFILCSPGTPCVFLKHWQQHKAEIKKLIEIRNAVGVHNNSAVKVLKTSNDCYMAEVTGSKGKLVVKIGSAMESPSGYSNSDIKASGTDYCIWTKTEVIGGGDDPEPTPEENLYVVGTLENSDWEPASAVTMTNNENVFTAENVTILAAKNQKLGYFSFITKTGSWDVVNTGNRYSAQTKDEYVTSTATISKYSNVTDCPAWSITPGIYTIKADLTTMTLTVTKTGSVEIPEPTGFKVYWNNSGANWTAPHVHYWGASESSWPGEEMKQVGPDLWVYTVPTGTTGLVFNYNGDENKTGNKEAKANYVYSRDWADVQAHEWDKVYVVGNIAEHEHWSSNDVIEMTKVDEGIYEVTVTIEAPKSRANESGYFSFITVPGAEWDDANKGTRFGAISENAPIARGESAQVYHHIPGVNDPGSAKSWMITPGTHKLTLNLNNMTVSVADITLSIDEISEDSDNATPVYYTLQGLRLAQPTAPGLYVVVRGSKVTKEFIAR